MKHTNTSADFYIGLGAGARWLGSVEVDGHPGAMMAAGLFDDTQGSDEYGQDEFLFTVGRVIDVSADVGDPWPWGHRTSADTAYVYAWNNGSIHVFERGYLIALHYPNGARKPSEFPTMGG